MKKRFTALFLVIISVFCCFFSGCKKSDEELIEARIEAFVDAYNDGDMDALLECMDRKSRKQLQATMNILGALSGALLGVDISLSDLFSLGISMTDEDWLTVTISNITVDGDEAVVNGKMSLNNGHFTENDSVTFFMLKEDSDWYVQDMKDYYVAPPTNDSLSDSTLNNGDNSGNGDSQNSENNENIGTQTAYKLVQREKFIDGRAWVTYQKDEQYTQYLGWIDTQGNVLYTAEAMPEEYLNIGKGAGIVRTETNLKLIGSDGNVLVSIDGEVEVKAYGDGYALIYQNKSTITKVEHLYGVVNYEGEWKMPLSEIGVEEVYGSFEHVSEYMFIYHGRNKVYFNAEEGNVMKVFNDYYSFLSPEGAVNGIFYTSEANIGIEKYDLAGEKIGETAYFAEPGLVFPDGTVQQVGDGEFIDGKFIKTIDGYLQITDYTKATPTTAIFDKYPAEMIENITFIGDYGLLDIRGADKQMYVTMIDTQGNERIEPLKDKYTGLVKFAEGGYLYFVEDGVTYCIDKDGNKVESKVEYSRIRFYGDIGLVSGTWTEYGYYIKSNGEKLFETLTVK